MRLLLVGLVVVMACGRSAVLPAPPLPPPPVDATLPPLGLLVEGVVTDRFGYAVPGASVTVRVGDVRTPGVSADPACRNASGFPSPTRTGPNGRFQTVVEAGRRQPFVACLEVEAIPPPRAPMHEGITIVPAARFDPLAEDGTPINAVQVHVVLH